MLPQLSKNNIKHCKSRLYQTLNKIKAKTYLKEQLHLRQLKETISERLHDFLLSVQHLLSVLILFW